MTDCVIFSLNKDKYLAMDGWVDLEHAVVWGSSLEAHDYWVKLSRQSDDFNDAVEYRYYKDEMEQ